MTKSVVLGSILNYLRLRGALPIRINAGMHVLEDANGNRRVFRGAEPGTSDIIACYHGRFLAIECKAGRNKTTALQEDFLQRVRDCGGIGIVAYDIDDVEKILDQLDAVKMTEGE